MREGWRGAERERAYVGGSEAGKAAPWREISWVRVLGPKEGGRVRCPHGTHSARSYPDSFV
jgi:hypothetical protein